MFATTHRVVSGSFLMALVAAIQLPTAPAAEVKVDTSVRHQTILGWSVNPWGPWVTSWQRDQVLDLAAARGIPNGLTEQMGNKLARMYDDLTRGGVSYWSTYGWGGVIEISHDGTSFRRGRYYWPLRQVMHYVRPGAVRVEASCDDESLRALAFVHRGRLTVVLMNDTPPARAQAVTISGLPAGRYGLARTAATGLSVAGKYVFALTAVDRTKATTRDVELTGGAEVGPGPFAGRAGDHPPAGPTLAMMSPWPAVVK